MATRYTAEQRQLGEDLWIAARDGKLDLVKAALEKGAPVDFKHRSRKPRLRPYPLHIAVFRNRVSVVRLLLSHGADPMLCNFRKENALQIGRQHDHVGPEVMQMLASAAARRSAKEGQGLKAKDVSSLLYSDRPTPLSVEEVQPKPKQVDDVRGSRRRSQVAPPSTTDSDAQSATAAADAPQRKPAVLLRAKWAYKASMPDELSFAKGDVITVVGPCKSKGWLLGTVSGCTGKFPINYVVRIRKE